MPVPFWGTPWARSSHHRPNEVPESQGTRTTSPPTDAERARRRGMAQPVVTTRILRRLLKTGALGRAEKLLERIHPADLGPLLSDLTPDEIRIVIDLLFKHQRAATMLRELPPELMPEIIEAISDQRMAEVLNRLEMDDMLELVDA
ncbi:MAG TPA: hypothetical protein ENI85_16745, partial [Deltaproteobacteria bacterium]|nr:hypothetical protein [Deltaproteobacteria bacterium]